MEPASPLQLTSGNADLQSLYNELLVQVRQQQKLQHLQRHQIYRPIATTTSSSTSAASSSSSATIHYHPSPQQHPLPSSEYNVYQAHKLKLPISIQQQQGSNMHDAPRWLSASPSSSSHLLRLNTTHNNNININDCSLTLLSPPGTNQPPPQQHCFNDSAAPTPLTPMTLSKPSSLSAPSSAFEFTSPSSASSSSLTPAMPMSSSAAIAAAVDALSLLSGYSANATHHYRSSSNASSTTTVPYIAAGGNNSSGGNKQFNIDSILSGYTCYNNAAAASKTSTKTLAMLVDQLCGGGASDLESREQQDYRQSFSSSSLNSPTARPCSSYQAAPLAAFSAANFANQIPVQNYGNLYCGTHPVELDKNDAASSSSSCWPGTSSAAFHSCLVTPTSHIHERTPLPEHQPLLLRPGFVQQQQQTISSFPISPTINNDGAANNNTARRRLEQESVNNNNATANGGDCVEATIIMVDDDDDDEQQQQQQNDPISTKSRHRCRDCRKVYSTFSGLVKHREHHCTALHTHRHECHFCRKQYNTLGALKMHVRTHTLPCKCKACGKAFSRPWLLQGHMRTHNGDKPFACDDCGRSFADRSNLRAHQQTHAIIKRYKCEDCLKTFSRLSLLNKHRAGTACKVRLLRIHQQQLSQPLL